MRQLLLLFPKGNPPKVTQLVSGGLRIRTQTAWLYPTLSLKHEHQNTSHSFPQVIEVIVKFILIYFSLPKLSLNPLKISQERPTSLVFLIWLQGSDRGNMTNTTVTWVPLGSPARALGMLGEHSTIALRTSRRPSCSPSPHSHCCTTGFS